MRYALLPCLILAACSSEQQATTFDPQARADAQAARERDEVRAAARAGFTPEAPRAIQTVSVDPPKTSAPGATLPPADRQYRYIGRWAATPALCKAGAWRFRVRALETAGQTSCKLPNIASVRTGYDLSGTCQTKGMRTEETLRLTFNEANRSMTVRGDRLGPATLIYCGD